MSEQNKVTPEETDVRKPDGVAGGLQYWLPTGVTARQIRIGPYLNTRRKPKKD